MGDRAAIDNWLAGYLEAWNDDAPEKIAAIFESDARYFSAPYREPHVGHEAIVSWWRGQGESDVEWQFEGGVIASEGQLHVIQGVTTYPGNGQPEVVYHNIWLVELAESGRARQFVEYWMTRD